MVYRVLSPLVLLLSTDFAEVPFVHLRVISWIKPLATAGDPPNHTKNPSLPGKDVWRQFSDRAFREHPGRHLELDPVNAVGLNHNLCRVVPAVRHEEIPEENPDGVQASLELKGMCAPRFPMRHSIN